MKLDESRVHIMWFHLYTILENGNEFALTESSLVVPCEGGAGKWEGAGRWE